MPRQKSRPDSEILESALALMHERGPEGLTFASLAERTGLSAATLVQRFGSKPAMVKAALTQSWDRLLEATEAAIATVDKSPKGAVELLVALSADYGAIDSYADGLLILREDLRDPDLRARGKAWGDRLSAALGECLAGADHPNPTLGRLMASHWQGALLWWSFDPTVDVSTFVEESLSSFLGVLRQGE